ncbi:hypothetical protein HAX54_025989, partial [Datura stramonium]|nr:hypothetical protein [Datura stramonium]
GQTTKATETTTDPVGEATEVELVCHTAPIPTSTPFTFGETTIQSAVESAETSFSMPQSSQYPFTPANFNRVESENDVPFIDLLGEQPKAAGIHPQDSARDEGESYKKKMHKKRKQEKVGLREALK